MLDRSYELNYRDRERRIKEEASLRFFPEWCYACCCNVDTAGTETETGETVEMILYVNERIEIGDSESSRRTDDSKDVDRYDDDPRFKKIYNAKAYERPRDNDVANTTSRASEFAIKRMIYASLDVLELYYVSFMLDYLSIVAKNKTERPHLDPETALAISLDVNHVGKLSFNVLHGEENLSLYMGCVPSRMGLVIYVSEPYLSVF
jgi:hypothetical protein